MLDILMVDEEQGLRDVLEEQLVERGHHVETADDGAAGAECVKRRMFDVVICDVRLPKIDGLTLFRRIRKEAPGTDVILMTAHSEVSQAVSALKEGAYDYLTKPFDLDELLLQVRRIDEVRSLRRELDTVRTALRDRPSSPILVGQAPGKEIGLQHLPQGMVNSNGAEALGEVALPTNNDIRPLQAAVRDFEHAYLLRALRATEGKRARTAELLGISRKTLWEKLRSDADRAASASRAAWTPPENEAIRSS